MGRIKHTAADDAASLTKARINKLATQWKRVYLLAKPLLGESDDIKALLCSHMQLAQVEELETVVGVIQLRTQTTIDWNAALKSLGLTDEKIEELKAAHAKKSAPFAYPPMDWSRELKAGAATKKKRAA